MGYYTKNGGLVGPGTLSVVDGVDDITSVLIRGGAAPPGQAEYTTPGTYSWECPTGVTSICVVCIGAGAAGTNNGARGGGGGGLGWKNNIAVFPGQSYTVVVGAGTTSTGQITAAGESYFINTSTVAGNGGTVVGTAASYVGDGGGNGGIGGVGSAGIESGGGGAGGYSGNGGDGASYPGAAAAGAGGGGGGGGYGNLLAGGGGGVGIYGGGFSGAAGIDTTGNFGGGGGGGSGGNNGDTGTVNGGTVSGGLYGGGGFGRFGNGGTSVGAGGAVRIIWGIGRQFPSTNTADV